jgi:cyclopropane fatty-acyl-phospholipid synthase-like methyltransferase
METVYKESIVKYYDNTRLDYRWLWLNKKNRSVHFGYYNDGINSHDEALLNLNRELAKRAEIRDGDIILDAGCGQGGSAFWLAENFKVTVSGITLVPHQVKIAQKDAKRRKLETQTNFSVQDYTNTQFKDESFSVIWACESMCHAEDKSKFYQEAMRLLKPGGRLICADYIRAKRPLLKQNERLLHSWLDGWSIKDLDTYDEHLEHAKNVGFSDVEIENVTEHTRPSLMHLHSMSSKLWTFGKMLKAIGLRNEINHGNQFGSIKQFEALESRLWYYGIISATKGLK